MGILLVFAAGYALGSRGSDERLDEVVSACRAIRRSDEFNGLVSAIRAHAAHSLRGLATTIERFGADQDHDDDRDVAQPTDLLERVRLLAARR